MALLFTLLKLCYIFCLITGGYTIYVPHYYHGTLASWGFATCTVVVKNTSRKRGGGGGGRNEDWRFRLAVKAVTGSRVPPLCGTVVTSPTWDGYYTGDEDPWQLMAASMRSTAARKIGLHIYMERMEQYFAANDVDAATKRHAILLTTSGAATYKLI